ncbi:hypothetical protein M569_16362, partial [Genlisea aurea]
MCSLKFNFIGFDRASISGCFCSGETKAKSSNAAAIRRSSFWGTPPDLCYRGEKERSSFDGRGIRKILSMSSSNELKMNLNEYMVTLDKPLGIRFALSLDGKVFVHALQKGGNAEKSRIVMVGDTLKKVSESSGGRLVEIKDLQNTKSIINEKSGYFSLVLERPFSPFPIHQLFLMDDLDVLFNRGRVSITTWNKGILASDLGESGDSSGSSGFAVFCPKFLKPQGWKKLYDQEKVRTKAALNPVVTIFKEEILENAEWGHGGFPLDEYAKAWDRSKDDLYYNHSLGMRYSKITEQIYVGSCIQTEEDVKKLADT